jgi:hypothetical protein
MPLNIPLLVVSMMYFLAAASPFTFCMAMPARGATFTNHAGGAYESGARQRLGAEEEL